MPRPFAPTPHTDPAGFAVDLRRESVIVCAGELDLADAIDPARTGVFAGLSQSKARAARRAHLRGDCAVAAPIASSFVEAWSKADVELGIVAEMRKIKTECCRRDAACGS